MGRVSPAEFRFKYVVRALCVGYELGRANDYPGPSRINRMLGRTHRKMNDINGRECRWREQIFAERRWRRVRLGRVGGSPKQRWEPPYQAQSGAVT